MDGVYIDQVLDDVHDRLQTWHTAFFRTAASTVCVQDEQNGTVLNDTDFVAVLHYTLCRMNAGSVSEDDVVLSHETFSQWAEAEDLHRAVRYMFSRNDRVLRGTATYLSQRTASIGKLETEFYNLGPNSKTMYMSRHGPVPTHSILRLAGTAGRNIIQEQLICVHLDVLQDFVDWIQDHRIPLTLYRLSVPLELFVETYIRTTHSLAIECTIPENHEVLTVELSKEIDEDSHEIISPNESVDFRFATQAYVRNQFARAPTDIVGLINTYIPTSMSE
jgi:hypothetical protein